MILTKNKYTDRKLLSMTNMLRMFRSKHFDINVMNEELMTFITSAEIEAVLNNERRN